MDRLIEIANRNYVVRGLFLKTARIAEEWFHDVPNPERSVEQLNKETSRIDLFSFWQRLPDVEPKYTYYMERESVAALPITDYDHWWANQVNSKTRNLIRKAEKKGVEIRLARFDDHFVEGMTELFNESKYRQGKRFWHYGKDEETIRREFSRNLFREDLIGAYYKEELIGFVFLAHAGPFAEFGAIISKFAHRDKSPTNALMAKAVELCASKNIPYLTYGYWQTGSRLNDFKRHNGFCRVELPRYFIPLTQVGKMALKMKAHHSPLTRLPPGLTRRLVNLRTKLNRFR